MEIENKINVKTRIEWLEGAIKLMEADEEIFGLVREDRDKILAWKLEIRLLKIKWKIKRCRKCDTNCVTSETENKNGN